MQRLLDDIKEEARVCINNINTRGISKQNVIEAKRIIDKFKLIHDDPKVKKQIQAGQFMDNTEVTLLQILFSIYTCPIIIWDGNKVVNGSGFFVDLDEKLLITNHHVVEGWRSIKKVTPGTKFQLGSISIPIESLLIDEDKNLDLATIKVPNEIFKEINLSLYKEFYISDALSSRISQKGDIVTLCGFPGSIRHDGDGYSNMHISTISEPVTDVSNNKTLVTFNRENWVQTLGVNTPENLTSLGGFSGGPVFYYDRGNINYVGTISEGMEGLAEGIFVVNGNLINRDGTLNKMS